MLANQATGANQGDNLDQIQALFRSTIPDVVARRNRFGNILTLSMPQDEFEYVVLNAGSDQESERFFTILAMLMKSDEDISYKMDMMVHIKSNTASVESIVKSGQYAEILQASGVPDFLMSAGLKRGVPNTVTMVFSHYRPLMLEVRS